jgi:alkylhydroperoxidase family enzyme
VTWLPLDPPPANERQAVLGLQANAVERWSKVLELSWAVTDPELLDLCRLRVAQLFACRAELAAADAEPLRALAAWRSAEVFSDLERAALAYTEQFVVDQNGVAGELEDELRRHLSQPELCNFVQALNAHDGYLRVLALLDVAPDADLPDSRPDRPPRREPAQQFRSARAAYGAATALLSGVDEVTTELCRLRNASHQACAYWLSARRAVARPAGVDDLLDEAIAYEHGGLPEHQKVALRLAVAFLAHPDDFPPEAQAETLQHFSPPQILELLLKLAAWSVNKSITALRLDAPIDENELTSFHYDADGALVLHR